MAGLISYRGAAFWIGLAFFSILEHRIPFRSRTDPALRHASVNLTLAAVNGGLLFLLVVGVERWGVVPPPTGLLSLFDIGPAWRLAASILYLDGVTYLFHAAYHRLPWLWRLHRVHHTDRDLDATSASRFHAGEVVLSATLRFIMAIPLGPSVAEVEIFALLLLFSAQFQHANFRLPAVIEPAVRAIFVTPDMHRVHHSEQPAETRANFSAVFSFWDRLFGTYRMAPQTGIVIGLPEYRERASRTLIGLLRMPFTRSREPAPRL